MKTSLIILFGLLYFYSYSQEVEIIVNTKIKILDNSKAFRDIKESDVLFSDIVNDIHGGSHGGSQELMLYSEHRYDSKIVCEYKEYNWDTSSVKDKVISISFPTIFEGFKHQAYFDIDSATRWSEEASLNITDNRITIQWDTPFKFHCEKTKQSFEKFLEDVLRKMDEESGFNDLEERNQHFDPFLNIEDYLGTDSFFYNDEFGPADPRLHSEVWNGYLVLRSVGFVAEYVETRLDKKTVKKLLKWLKYQDLTDSGYSDMCDRKARF
ncbi:hypothetical protein N8203_01740 [Crocinitomicaceae bacterium]|nr:hypothetical protein [Crocinitomicaceae bacterium]